MAWDVLNADDKAEILALFPDQSHVLDPGTEQARPNLTALRNDDTFRHDCATYTGNLSQGRFDPEWLACAWTAHERRKMGDFDEHLNNKFEYEWQVDLPEDFMPKRVPPSIETEGDMGENGQPGSKDTHENLAQDEDGEKHEEGQDSENHFTDDHEESAAKSGDDAAEQGDCTDSMVIDELQAEGGRPSAHIMPIVRRQSTKMDIVGTESEDELA